MCGEPGTPVDTEASLGGVDSGLRLVLAPTPTPTAAAYSRLLNALSSAVVGDVAEFSPAGAAMAFEIATKIGACNGGARVLLPGSRQPLLLGTASGVTSPVVVPRPPDSPPSGAGY